MLSYPNKRPISLFFDHTLSKFP